MADSCCTYMHELDDIHRWLPAEILRDIGIVGPAERRCLAVVEDLAARLDVVVGSAVERTQQHHAVPPSRVANSY
ncbi:hypothetical protein E2562_004074 [Oryza meyeriana var. granulata]|uniref:Uncharacterized protein n=1 Tax=Oryza meyeriana var. granulata TaxID=110450 RepID=A0A6G1BIW4_9ORYZ|nr:hypothetical protein E2562_004074 [Oryza meyeriana var. granulata]